MRVQRRFWVLDYIRITLAAIVAMGHLSGPFLPEHSRWKLLRLAFSGPAAVVIFFVISGFCIHLPNIGKHKLQLLPYVARREIRIGAPALIAMVLAFFIRQQALMLDVMWSLWCEEIYYLLYPLILRVRFRHGWRQIWIVAIITFFVGRLTSHFEVNTGFVSPGLAKTWMIGLPCWLIGCNLAEFASSDALTKMRPISNVQIWSLRLLVWACAGAIDALRFHANLDSMVNLVIFSFLGAFWLACELKHSEHTDVAVPPYIEASYSLYLCHLLVPPILAVLSISVGGPVSVLLGVITLTYTFYFCVERPFHHLARNVGRKLTFQRPVEVVSVPEVTDIESKEDDRLSRQP